MHLVCSTCATPLTRELKWVAVEKRRTEMGDQMLEPGALCKEDGSWLQNRAGACIVNVTDVINTVLTEDPKRLNGCCGLDGCDGANLRAKNARATSEQR